MHISVILNSGSSSACREIFKHSFLHPPFIKDDFSIFYFHGYKNQCVRKRQMVTLYFIYTQKLLINNPIVCKVLDNTAWNFWLTRVCGEL